MFGDESLIKAEQETLVEPLVNRPPSGSLQLFLQTPQPDAAFLLATSKTVVLSGSTRRCPAKGLVDCNACLQGIDKVDGSTSAIACSSAHREYLPDSSAVEANLDNSCLRSCSCCYSKYSIGLGQCWLIAYNTALGCCTQQALQAHIAGIAGHLLAMSLQSRSLRSLQSSSVGVPRILPSLSSSWADSRTTCKYSP